MLILINNASNVKLKNVWICLGQNGLWDIASLFCACFKSPLMNIHLLHVSVRNTLLCVKPLLISF
jgi:hypothetical protein